MTYSTGGFSYLYPLLGLALYFGYKCVPPSSVASEAVLTLIPLQQVLHQGSLDLKTCFMFLFQRRWSFEESR